jgi:ankyrin repeat protein
MTVCNANNLSVVQYLLGRGESAAAVDAKGFMPLHSASYSNSPTSSG